MTIFKSIINLTIVSAVMLAISPNIHAQDIPYGITDKEKLKTILIEAQKHLASNENDLNWLKSAGIANHQLAVIKVDGASNNAVNNLKKATELDKNDSVLLAYLGSSYAMAGRDSSFVVSKVTNVNKGLAVLDKAVKKDPSDLNIRFIRASVSYSLPDMFSRKATAESDYLLYTKEAEAGSQQVAADRIAEAYFKLGRLAQEKNQKTAAQDFYAKAQKASPQSEWAQQAAAALK
jgi:tetratricopeptide (TPR) repeat protein